VTRSEAKKPRITTYKSCYRPPRRTLGDSARIPGLNEVNCLQASLLTPLKLMNPDSVTVGQLISSFRWKHWASAISLVASVVSSVGYGGYWAGQYLEQSKSGIELAELRGSLSQVQGKLEAAQGRSDQLAATLQQWQAGYQKLQAELSQQQSIDASLAAQLGRASNCTFIQEQILATQKLMESPSGVVVFSADEEHKRQERERVAALQHRLDGYQQQLVACSR
jgi:endonuclease/exonuclease/phosphatase (EEP) superfamily protein YafD